MKRNKYKMLAMNIVRKIGVVVSFSMLLVLLTAFGCKQDEAANENTEATNDQSTQVTYNINPDTTDTPTEDTTGTVTYDAENANQESTENTNAEASTENTNVNENTNTNTNEASDSTEAKDTANGEDREVLDLSEKIVEIFGSYTNKGKEPYSNIKDIEGYATTSFKSWLDNLQEDTLDPNDAFYGITTKALSSAVLESTPNSATILVTTKREEITETSQAARTFYAMIVIEMVKEGGEWKANGLYWQE